MADITIDILPKISTLSVIAIECTAELDIFTFNAIDTWGNSIDPCGLVIRKRGKKMILKKGRVIPGNFRQRKFRYKLPRKLSLEVARYC